MRVLFTVPELEKGNQIKFYYMDENEKRTLLKNVTVTNPLLPKLTFTNKLYEQSKSIDYKISNYDERLEEGSILVKYIDEDLYNEYIVENTGSIALDESFEIGTQLKLYYANKNDREFYLTTIKVQSKLPKLTVPSVTNRTKTLKVTYEENSSVTLKSGRKHTKEKI